MRELIDYIESYYQSFSTQLPLGSLKKNAELFYAAVNKRDDALTSNVIRALNEYDTPLAIFISGGFHTEGISERLSEKGISFLVLTPKIDHTDESGIQNYYDVMKEFWYGRK